MLTKFILLIFKYLKKIFLKNDFEIGLIGTEYIFKFPYLIVCCQCLPASHSTITGCFNIVQNYFLEAILSVMTKMRVTPID